MKLLFRLFARKPAVKPATVRVHNDADDGPPWRGITPLPPVPPPPGPEHYAPKKSSGAIDITVILLLLPRDQQERMSRLLRQGYGPALRAA